jgi:hypothetical protein
MRYWLIIGFLLILVVFGEIANFEFLEVNFRDNGETFLKGYGHILEEDYSKGLIFIIFNSSLISLFVGILVIGFIVFNDQQWINKGVLYLSGLVVFILIIYGLIQLMSYYYDKYINKERIIEITVTWISVTIGVNLSYWICRQVKKITVSAV